MVKEYEEKTENFLKENNKEVKINYAGRKKYFAGDKEERDVYNVVVKDKNSGNKETFKYGASINDTYENKKPTKDEVLWAIQMDKNSYENSNNADDFSDEYGYDKKEGKKIYSKVEENSKKYDKVFDENNKEELDKLYEDY